jgi:hypothetical protein
LFELSLIRCVNATSSVLQCPYVSFVLRNIDVCVDPVIITAGDAMGWNALRLWFLLAY